MHNEMRVGQLAMDLLDHVHRQHRAIRLAGEFIGAVRGAHGDRQRIDLGFPYEFDGLVRIGEQLVMRKLAFGAMAILGLAHAGFERPQHPEFAFDGYAAEMRHLGDRLRHADIVIPIGWCLRIGLEGAVHHHGGEAGLDGRHAA